LSLIVNELTGPFLDPLEGLADTIGRFAPNAGKTFPVPEKDIRYI
jgi:hypothetical protein